MAGRTPGINRAIVIVNEFTVNGSRGNSPGNYIREYMARDKASENLTPTMVRSEHVAKMAENLHKDFVLDGEARNMADYVVRYMARESAVEDMTNSGDPNIAKLVGQFDDIQGMSGIAFAQDDLSLSHDDVKRRSKRIQAEYEKGKPVMKTVISFDTDYLKAMGVLPEDLEIKKRGDLYGKADQAKLRIAIQNGLRRIRSSYSDLDWIGVIQVDTKHLHCHLAMVDRGEGKRFAKTGEQKGMLSDDMKMAIRRGIHNSLDESQKIKSLNIQMESERRNTISYIKRFTHKIAEERGLPQYLLACLPKDNKALWTADFNADGGSDNEMTIKNKRVRGNMKKANEIVRSYVIDLLNRPDSGFAEAMREQHELLVAWAERGDFSDRRTGKGKGRRKAPTSDPIVEIRKREEEYKEKIIKSGMNAVYDVLKSIDDRTMTVHTPLMDAMAMPFEDMAAYVKEDKLIEFGFRLRSYSSRLAYHTEAYDKASAVIADYEDGDTSRYNPESKKLYDFMKIEQEYNHSLMCKYRTFLHFYHVKDEYENEYEDMMALRHRSYARHAMKDDKALKRYTRPEELEQKGREVYGIEGASQMLLNPQAFDAMLAADDRAYMQGLRDFRTHLNKIGMLYDSDKDEISRGMEYDFESVKAYDLHHMSYDFAYDFRIASQNIDNFAKMAYRRYDAYIEAKKYLDSTGQGDALKDIVSEDDIRLAKELADQFGRDPTYHTKVEDGAAQRHNSRTIRLDDEAYNRLSNGNMAKSLREMIREIEAENRQRYAENSGEDFI